MRPGSVLAVSLVLALSAGTASAAVSAGSPPPGEVEAGVHIDPRTPAAKEYALPLVQARNTGGGAHGGHGLFGVGIRPHADRMGAARLAPRARKHGAAARARDARPAGRDSAGALVAPAPAAKASKSSSDDSLLALLGGGVTVLVVGALAGTILRRRPVRPRI